MVDKKYNFYRFYEFFNINFTSEIFLLKYFCVYYNNLFIYAYNYNFLCKETSYINSAFFKNKNIFNIFLKKIFLNAKKSSNIIYF